MLDDTQAMAPDQREHVVAGEVAEMLVARARRTVRRLDLLRPAEHREGCHLDEQERTTGLEQAAPSATAPRRGRARGSRRASRGRDRSSRACREALDVADVQARFRERRAQAGEALRVGIEAGVRDPPRPQERRELVPIELLAAADVEHPSAQAADPAGDSPLLARERLAVDDVVSSPAPEALSRARAADGIGKDPMHAVLEIVENARRRAIDEQMAQLGFDARELRVGEVAGVADVTREPICLDQP